MIIKVLNENPFQILTSAMSIGPSETGYVLEVSADSVNFSPLFSVAANTTKMATGLAPNSYYRLKGNEGEVTVNWSRSCVTEGGGSGSGTTYQAGDGIIISGDIISVDSGYVSTAVDNAVSGLSFTTSADVETQIESYNFITSGQAQTLIDSAITQIDLSSAVASANTYTDGAISGVSSQLNEVERVTSIALNDLNDKKVASNDIRNIVKMTQAQYDALSGSTVATTLYVITQN